MMESSSPQAGAFTPLRSAVFRTLWLVWAAANTTMWMNDVTSAWVMTSIARSALWVALVQSATALPVFLLALPFGALADALDRRNCLVGAQLYAAFIGTSLFISMYFGIRSPLLLLALTFANSAGVALTWAVFATLTPQVVSRYELPQALAMNSLGMNMARISGPLIAGVVIAHAGSAYVYLANAAIATVSASALLRWRGVARAAPHSSRGLLGDVIDGLRFSLRDRIIRHTVIRAAVFYFNSVALLALLALLARNLGEATASTFSVLLATMGLGAVLSTMVLPRLRRRWSAEARVLAGSAVYAVAAAALASSRTVGVAALAMVLAGFAWLLAGNSLSVEVQLAANDAMRARTMSVYQMVMMGSAAAGAAAWGWVAAHTSVSAALLASSLTVLALMLMATMNTLLTAARRAGD
jgi:predicted MFS family arabinose efflux permease